MPKKNNEKELKEKMLSEVTSFESFCIHASRMDPLIVRDALFNMQITIILNEQDITFLKKNISKKADISDLPSRKVDQRGPTTELVTKACTDASAVLAEMYEIHNKGLH
tara:strand:+ start:411 stop:737 length:327 start_codon:yes stop_codon:yes gene_type:complete